MPTPEPTRATSAPIWLEPSELRDYSGIWFDPRTGQTYLREGETGGFRPTGFTFENARWNGPWGFGVWPWLNPISFATEETAVALRDWLRSWAPPGLTFAVRNDQTILGPFSRTIERRIAVTDSSGRTEEFSAGEMTNWRIRQGDGRARTSMLAEWYQAGLRW